MTGVERNVRLSFFSLSYAVEEASMERGAIPRTGTFSCFLTDV